MADGTWAGPREPLTLAFPRLERTRGSEERRRELESSTRGLSLAGVDVQCLWRAGVIKRVYVPGLSNSEARNIYSWSNACPPLDVTLNCPCIRLRLPGQDSSHEGGD